jgi:DNA-binding response OmpR family regulator
MRKILMIEDDQVVSTIYRSKFVADGFDFELAPDGEAGVRLARSFRPEVVILDLGLPKLDGIEVIKQLRADPANSGMPIIVLTNAYLANRVKDAWAAGATRCVTKSDCTPRTMIQIIRNLNNKPLFASEPAAEEPQAEVPVAPKMEAPAAPKIVMRDPGLPKLVVPEVEAPVSPLDSVISFPGREQLLKAVNTTDAFLAQAPAALAKIRHNVLELSRSTRPSTTLFFCGELYQAVRSLGAKAGLAELTRFARMSSALEALLKELHDRPEMLTASSQRTVAQAIDFLDELVRKKGGEDVMTTVEGVMVVDDEPLSRRAVVMALNKVGLESMDLDDPQTALAMLTSTQFDLFLLDIDMPGMNGFELCRQIRSLPPYRTTPVIFVSSLTDFQSRAQSTLSGGNDLIAKPFHFLELGVKALIHLWRPQLNRVA